MRPVTRIPASHLDAGVRRGDAGEHEAGRYRSCGRRCQTVAWQGMTTGFSPSNRAEMVHTGRWPDPGPKKAGPWGQLIDRLSRLLEIPASPGCGGMRRRDFVMRLAEESDGRPGLAIEWVKEAAEFAVMNGVGLDLDALQATSAYPARRLSAVAPVAATRKRRAG